MKNRLLVLGDVIVILIVTIIGFVTHSETDMSFLPRFLAVFLPLTLAWFLLAPWFGLFNQEIASNPKQLWRPVLAILYAAPFAALLRGLYLGTPIIPIFALILAATSAFGMLIWRAIFALLARRQ
jgi:flagellar biosynthesis protein FliQ